MIWEIITSISTLAAVIVALFLPTIINKRKLIVEATTPGRYSEQKDVIISIINSGGKFITVSRLLIMEANKKIKEMRYVEGKLPVTLKPSEFVHLKQPYISEHLDEIKQILIEDSLGHRWKCTNKSIINTNKILKEYIGDRMIYPSMGDKIYEE